MNEKKTLQDYYWGGFPKLVNAVISGEKKLVAQIYAQPRLYFLPESILIRSVDEVLDSLATDTCEKQYLAESGEYEICDTSYVLHELERIIENEGGENHLTIQKPVTYEGVKGILTAQESEKCFDRYEINNVRVPFYRIFVEDIHSKDQMNEYQISTTEEPEPTKTDPIKALMFRYFPQANGLYDFDRCMEFVLKDAEVDEKNGRILYTSFNGKHQNPLRKSIEGRYNKYLKEWKSQNP